jgi:hypothetical protein
MPYSPGVATPMKKWAESSYTPHAESRRSHESEEFANFPLLLEPSLIHGC